MTLRVPKTEMDLTMRGDSLMKGREWNGLSVPLRVDSLIAVDGGCQPLTAGVPLPKGQVWEPVQASFVEPHASDVTLQTRVLANWSDGSVKWLLLECLSPSCSAGITELTLLVAPAHRDAAHRSGFQVQERRDAVVVDTGVTVFEIDTAKFAPFRAVQIGERTLTSAPLSSTLLTDRKGRKCTLRVESCEVETVGPVRMTACLAGRIDYCRGMRWKARLSFFAGTGLTSVRLTVHNPNRARHRGGLWDLGDQGSFFFQDLSIEIAQSVGSHRQLVCRMEPGAELEQFDGNKLEIYQDSSGGENWQSRNHVNHKGRVPCRIQGYRVTTADGESFGRRANPVVMTGADDIWVSASIPEFWQQFPKAIDCDEERIHASLFPNQWDDLFELQGGERKTHAVWLDFAAGECAHDQLLNWTHQPAQVLATPEWYSTAEAIPFLTPAAADMDQRLQDLMSHVIAGDKSFFAGRETIDEYGWRNYGDVWADHEQAYYTGPPPVISHYNNQFDIVYGAILQMLRTGDRSWWGISDPLARHVMDIDIYHTTRDKAAYNGGLFWFTDHYVDAVTSSHRTYSQANRPKDGRPYGGGPGSEHNFATGLLYYYYLTGDLDARDSVLELANWVIRMDDGGQTIFRFVDDGPTGLASICGSPDYHGPGRGGANSIQVLLDAWTLTREAVYLDKAEELIRRCIHPADDLDRLDLLNAELRWSYTMFLSALAMYLEVKAEADLVDEMYAYARESLLHYVTWMMDHERPYLDHPENLEYPTEAWAAQEFRKANVFFLASRHAEESLAKTMRERGGELSQRAWSDLLSFDTRTMARAQALLMIEGARDACFRNCVPASVGACLAAHDFGSPTFFVPQKTRSISQLKSVSGVVRLIGRLLSPRVWMTSSDRVHPMAGKRVKKQDE